MVAIINEKLYLRQECSRRLVMSLYKITFINAVFCMNYSFNLRFGLYNYVRFKIKWKLDFEMKNFVYQNAAKYHNDI